MSKNGLILLKPTTVDKTGASSTATISALGSVEFGSCETLSLNGVFTSAYDNYMIVYWGQAASTGQEPVYLRLRTGGADNSTANSYTIQYVFANGTSVSGARWSATLADFFTYTNNSSYRSGAIGYLYGPSLTQPTAMRSANCYGVNGGAIIDYAITHNQSISYDGFTFSVTSPGISGRVAVYGMRK
jgi:hypothetical protein